MKNRTIRLIALALSDFVRRGTYRLGVVATNSGTQNRYLDVEESVAYIELVHDEYVRALASIGEARLTGTLAEIGPGDNFGVALKLLKEGGDFVHLVDRFRPIRNQIQQDKIYQALAEKYDLRDYFNRSYTEGEIRNVEYHVGAPAETFFQNRDTEFDAIISRTVLSFLVDPILALERMWAALKPGGVLVHQIDLRCLGILGGQHSLEFLTIPDFLYALLTKGSGRVNRVMFSHYKEWIQSRPVEGKLIITGLVGCDEALWSEDWNSIEPDIRAAALASVHTVRPQLARSLKAFKDEDLSVSGCMLVVKKPQSIIRTTSAIGSRPNEAGDTFETK